MGSIGENNTKNGVGTKIGSALLSSSTTIKNVTPAQAHDILKGSDGLHSLGIGGEKKESESNAKGLFDQANSTANKKTTIFDQANSAASKKTTIFDQGNGTASKKTTIFDQTNGTA